MYRHTNIRGEQNDEDEKTKNEEKKMGPKRTLDEMVMMMRKHKAKEQKEMKRQHFLLCLYDFL